LLEIQYFTTFADAGNLRTCKELSTHRPANIVFFSANVIVCNIDPKQLMKIFSGSINMKAITAKELSEKLRAGDDIQLIDVREPDENAFAKIEGARLIPLGQVVSRMNEIDPERETVVHCKGGVRSAKAIEALQQAGFKGDLANLTGGITAWSNDVDPSVPKY